MKLESHHSVLTTSKKQNKLKINNSSQIHQIIDVTGQTSPLPLRYRKKRVDIENLNSLDQKSMGRNL